MMREMVSPSQPLQKAVYDALVGSDELMSMVNGVFDGQNHESRRPDFIEIDDVTGSHFSSKQSGGMEMSVILHTYTNKRGKKTAQEIHRAILRAVNDLYHLDGFVIVRKAVGLENFEPEMDDRLIHGILEIEFYILEG